MKEFELLAPAGDEECFFAAINAGADAIYLGGSKFGARAYATNFETNRLCELIDYAHLFHVKIYLTLNILLKEIEFKTLYEYLAPLYQCGLDAVIVQDLGVVKYLQLHFPKLEIHASTQMGIMNTYGVQLLKRLGITRTVLARELTLKEISHIKNEQKSSLEVFIHGSMCYAYSGQCLFSSFLGGRSGNRGRCAGPCRLPYDTQYDKDKYPLSLKDLNTLELLPKLMSAGVDSYKIEGRMKNPYYVAGVTSIYRKYMDMYIAGVKDIQIQKEDKELLRNLYIRTDVAMGYLNNHNSQNMITLHKPSYKSCIESEYTELKDKYINMKKKYPIYIYAKFHVNEPAELMLYDDFGNSSTVTSDFLVEIATKQPMSERLLDERLKKSGTTDFFVQSIDFDLEGDVFIPMKSLNDLRRLAYKNFLDNLMEQYRRELTKVEDNSVVESISHKNKKCFGLKLKTLEQFKEALNLISVSEIPIEKLEIDLELVDELTDNMIVKLKELSILKSVSVLVELPNVFRKKEQILSDKFFQSSLLNVVSGIKCNSLDSLEYCNQKIIQLKLQCEIHCGPHLYVMNHYALDFLHKFSIQRVEVPYELSQPDMKSLANNTKDVKFEKMVYGYIPFMYSANCIKKTFGHCDSKSTIQKLTDRKGKNNIVVNSCKTCKNIIYNSVPLSLHNELDSLDYNTMLLSFTIESAKEMKAVFHMFENVYCKRPVNELPFKEFTKGHFKKGIE